MGLRLSEPGRRGRQRGLAILILALLLGCTDAPKDTVRVLIILDTVRAQSLSACGYERPTSPTLERLVAEGHHLNCTAIAPGSWTLPSHASYFTGLEAPEHGAHATASETSWHSSSMGATRRAASSSSAS